MAKKEMIPVLSDRIVEWLLKQDEKPFCPHDVHPGSVPFTKASSFNHAYQLYDWYENYEFTADIQFVTFYDINSGWPGMIWKRLDTNAQYFMTQDNFSKMLSSVTIDHGIVRNQSFQIDKWGLPYSLVLIEKKEKFNGKIL